MNTNKNIKKRNWAFVAYPESLPTDWIDILIQKGMPFAVSPLHDKDINPDGVVKKSHYHVILCYEGPTSYNVVKSITEELNSPIPQALEQVKGYYRYFTHKDNPEKYQYDEQFIKCFNGFSICDYMDLTKNEVNNIIVELIDFIKSNNIYEYYTLINAVLDAGNLDYFTVARSHTIFFNSYISSFRCFSNTKKNNK